MNFFNQSQNVSLSLSINFSSLRSEEHTSELQSRPHLVCRLLLEKKKRNKFKLELSFVYHRTQQTLILSQYIHLAAFLTNSILFITVYHALCNDAVTANFVS